MTKDLEEALGVVKYMEKKAEFYSTETELTSDVNIRGDNNG